MMKYRKMKMRLAKKQEWWDKLPQAVKDSTTKPGSIKKR